MLGGTFEENIRLIKPLKEKYKIYGLTNWSAETLPIAMERYDFFRDMDGMVVSGEEKLVKPDKKNCIRFYWTDIPSNLPNRYLLMTTSKM